MKDRILERLNKLLTELEGVYPRLSEEEREMLGTKGKVDYDWHETQVELLKEEISWLEKQ